MDEIEDKISELSSTYQQFQVAVGDTNNDALYLIRNQIDEVKNIYSGYITVIHNLENACSAAGISTRQTLFRMHGNDFFYEKGGRKFSLGVFIIKQSTYHMAIPIKLTNKYKYVGTVTDRQFVSYVTVNIYKPKLINSSFDGRKALDVPGMSGFTWRHGTEPDKLLSLDINLNTDTFEFSKLQMNKIKKAIETTMTESGRQQQIAVEAEQATAAQPTSVTIQQEVDIL